jgi:Fe-S-cluster-containing dehydrogenase component
MKVFGRRKFFGMTAAAGLAGFASEHPFALASPSRRWAMIVDLKKCGGKKDCTLCISACNKAHNGPGRIPSRTLFRNRFTNSWRKSKSEAPC